MSFLLNSALNFFGGIFFTSPLLSGAAEEERPQLSDDVWSSAKKQNSLDDMTRKLGSEEEALKCIERFKHLNEIDRRRGEAPEKLSPSDAYLAYLICEYNLSRRVAMKLFSIGGPRYARLLKNGRPLKNSQPLKNGPPLKRRRALEEEEFSWQHSLDDMTRKLGSEEEALKCIERFKDMNEIDRRHREAPEKLSPSDAYLAYLICEYNLSQWVVRSLFSIGGPRYARLRPHGSARSFHKTRTSFSPGTFKGEEHVTSARSLYADLSDHSGDVWVQQEVAYSVSCNENHPSAVGASYEGEKPQVLSARSLYADLADSGDVLAQQQESTRTVTRNEAAPCGVFRSYSATARLISTQLMRTLNGPRLILHMDSLTDKKLSKVLYRDEEDEVPISRIILEMRHICENSKCHYQGKPR